MRPPRAARPGAVAALLAVLTWLPGCAAVPGDPGWAARWPGAGDLGEAAVRAARSPATWVPLTAAAVLAVGDLDQDVSDWAADHRPLFGSDAAETSDDLRNAARAAWLVTALAAPSHSLTDKAGGLAVGAATLMLEDEVTDFIKDAADRRRPDGSNNQSFTSGHAGTASAAATLARHNLDAFTLPGWLDVSLRVGLHGVALGTGWARVEAERHHVTDVLAGYAVGHFLASFMDHAFMRPRALLPLTLTFRPLPDGGAVTVVLKAH